MHKIKMFIRLLFVFSLISAFGCGSIRHKTFRIVSVAQGGKITITDPSGTGTPMPQIVIGSFTGICNTIPIGCKMKVTTKTYQLFSSDLAFEEVMEIDATKVPVEILYEKKEDE